MCTVRAQCTGKGGSCGCCFHCADTEPVSGRDTIQQSNTASCPVAQCRNISVVAPSMIISAWLVQGLLAVSSSQAACCPPCITHRLHVRKHEQTRELRQGIIHRPVSVHKRQMGWMAVDDSR